MEMSQIHPTIMEREEIKVEGAFCVEHFSQQSTEKGRSTGRFISMLTIQFLPLSHKGFT